MLSSREKLRSLLPEMATVLGLLAAPFILPHIGFVLDTMNRVLVLGLLGIGFDLLFGYAGLLSFGQSAFFGTGGFVAAYLLTQMGLSSVFLSLMIGTFAAAVAGYLVGLIALRRTGIYFAMITVAIAEVFFFMENSPLSKFTGGENGLPGVPSPILYLGFTTIHATGGLSMYGFLAAIYFAGIVIARRIVVSPVGRIMVAIRENPLRAAAVGHNIHAYKLLVFIIAAAYAGLAGGLLGVLQGYMPPDAFAFDTSGQLIMQTVIGGLQTLFGPLVGAAVWLYLRDTLQSGLGLGAAWKLVLGVVFVLLVCFLKRGIIGGFADLFALLRGALKKNVLPATIDELGSSGEGLPLANVVNPIGVPPMQSRAVNDYAGPILEARNLSKRYGGLLANDGIDFVVKTGELRGIIGPNGAGKSTFFKMLTCEVHPSSGSIVFEGRDITGFEVTKVCQLGLTKSYQVNQLFTRLTARQNIMISALAEKRGSFRLDFMRNAARIPGLEEQIQHTLDLVELTKRADVAVSDLAYGEKRRLEIGLALATSPSLLLLDEPLAGMSPRERAETVKLLKSISRGRTTIIIDHDMDALFELVDNVTVLREGRILVEGTPAEIKSNDLVREAYLGGGLE
jgi:branched-chain amino acid transport system permease protein